MDIETEGKYTKIIYRLFEYYPLFEKALEDGDICDEVISFLFEDLNDCYTTIKELREDIYHVRENFFKIRAVACNLFRFDFFFLLKGLRVGVEKIVGENPTDVNFVIIGNQIQFLDTTKYFQQSLGALAENLTDKEKFAISKDYENFIKNDPKLSKKCLSCSEEEQKCVLNYMSTGKGSIPYEMLTE